MRKTRTRITGVGLAASLGAGLAAALLALMPALKAPGGLTASIGDMSSTGAAAWFMAFVAPLPIMVASLGFGSLAGLIAMVVGSLAVGLVDLRPDSLAAFHLDKIATGGLETLVFAVSFGIPSWLLAQLAVLPAAAHRANKALVRPEEQRLGIVIAVAAGFSAVGAAISVAIAADGHGSLRGFIEASAAAVEPLLTQRSGSLPADVDMHRVALAFVWAALAIMAAGELLLLTFNLWIAARIAQASGLLSAPWPDIPSGLRVPRPLAIVLAVALGLSFAGNQLGAAGVIVSGALGMAFALQGLAVVHAVTRGRSVRLPLLIIVYLTLIMLMPWSLVAYALLGLVDAAVSFRDRQKPIVKKLP